MCARHVFYRRVASRPILALEYPGSEEATVGQHEPMVEEEYSSCAPHRIDGTESPPDIPPNEGCNWHPSVAKSASLAA